MTSSEALYRLAGISGLYLALATLPLAEACLWAVDATEGDDRATVLPPASQENV